jgi:hypothetical protein
MGKIMQNGVSRRGVLLATAGLLVAPAVRAFAATAPDLAFEGQAIFDRILARATENRWAALPIGECMGRIAMEFEGTPYVAFTLEVSLEEEFCVVNLTGLDCVTFFENVLGFARMLKTGGRTPADLLKQVTFTRYRGGKVTDFASRLHYTTDWFHDNELKKTAVDLSPRLPGSEPFGQKVGIMSAKPDNYRQLKHNPALLPAIRQTEEAINARPKRYVPLSAIAAAEHLLQTGDIVGMTTTMEGIDISHTGLVMVGDDGVRRFMDASSSKSKMKVTLEPGPLHKDLSGSKTTTGAIFARPLEPG